MTCGSWHSTQVTRRKWLFWYKTVSCLCERKKGESGSLEKEGSGSPTVRPTAGTRNVPCAPSLRGLGHHMAHGLSDLGGPAFPPHGRRPYTLPTWLSFCDVVRTDTGFWVDRLGLQYESCSSLGSPNGKTRNPLLVDVGTTSVHPAYTSITDTQVSDPNKYLN